MDIVVSVNLTDLEKEIIEKILNKEIYESYLSNLR